MFKFVLFSREESVNKLVRTFLVSETLLWSGWNFFFPIIALFIVGRIRNSEIETVALAYSLYLMTRVVAELLSGRYVSVGSQRAKVSMVIIGQLLLSFSYLGFIFSYDVIHLFTVYIAIGVGLGVSSPAKLAIFSTHLDKNKESKEWSYYDATSLLGMAVAGIIGGFVATQWGFDVVFLIASVINFLAILPYFFFFRRLTT